MNFRYFQIPVIDEEPQCAYSVNKPSTTLPTNPSHLVYLVFSIIRASDL